MDINTVGPRVDWSIERKRENFEKVCRDYKNIPKSQLETMRELLEFECGLTQDSQYKTLNTIEFLNALMTLFDVPKTGKISTNDLLKLFEGSFQSIQQLYTRMNSEGMFEDAQSSIRFNRFLEYMYHVRKSMCSLLRAQEISQQSGELVPAECKEAAVVFAGDVFNAPKPEETNDYQKLLLYLLNCAFELGYRKYNGECYVQKYIDEQYTYAWERKCSIQEFVYKVTSKNFNFDMWKCMTGGKGNASSAADYLAQCMDPEFPYLVKDRHVFSFRNGVYVAKHFDGTRFVDMFWPFASDKRLPQRIVACKYFDYEFRDFADVQDWYDIPTPNLHSVMEYQEFPEDVIRWMYVFIGRLIYEVGELDGWQVIPFLKGTAGSGKSTIALKVCGNIFEKSDVGILSNNIERKFGISAFSDKYLFVAPEIKSDLQMEQAEFQSIVSGEDVQVNVKFAKAKSCEWKVPGILAGNEVPKWADNSGSIARRTIVFNFENQVVNGDMDLAKKLDAEMPAILKKCNLAYLETAQRLGSKNIWNHLPKYFRKTREELEESTNPLEHFLNSGKIQILSGATCAWQEFVDAFREHAQSMNLGKYRIDKDFVKTPFSKRHIHYDKDTNIIRGARLVTSQSEFTVL